MKTLREMMDQLDEINRRDFLKGAGAAAVAGAGLAPTQARAHFEILVPILKGILGSDIPRSDTACMPRGVKLGQKVFWRGETQSILQIYGEYQGCKNPDFPIAVQVGKPVPEQAPIVKEPPNQNLLPYGQKIAARIKPNMVFNKDIEGNPQCDVVIRVEPDGTITDVKLAKPSDDPDWDRAVIDAIHKTQKLPLDTNGSIPPEFLITWKAKEFQPQKNPVTDPDLEQKRRENLKRIAPGVKEDSEQIEETSPEALSKIDKLFNK